ncbi:hypothetical protein MYA98_07700 [Salmonella sp. WGH-01]|nr:hypothetical protein MYA98_07700 [Salmonella sp. WGH-01]
MGKTPCAGPAIVAALGFASPLAIADNPVSYTDGVKHDLSDDSPISYSGTGEGSALHLEGLATPEGAGRQRRVQVQMS